ncbi:hypothetical protein [Sinosporangium siamense]|uniref:hypothetical protein n=1 Tax=Sinosporangium siamense TaxID=1367973 RepID=UPI0019510C93|nr:hypothetical protein [Sinosporangium siamense]
MSVRLMGLPEEVDAVTAALSELPAVQVVAVSRPYPCRGRDLRVRVYVEIRSVEESR